MHAELGARLAAHADANANTCTESHSVRVSKGAKGSKGEQARPRPGRQAMRSQTSNTAKMQDRKHKHLLHRLVCVLVKDAVRLLARKRCLTWQAAGRVAVITEGSWGSVERAKHRLLTK